MLAHSQPVSQSTLEVPFYSIIIVVALFSVSAILNMIFISRQAFLRCRNQEEKVEESVENPSTYGNSIYVQENRFSTYRELEQIYKNVHYDIYTSLE